MTCAVVKSYFYVAQLYDMEGSTGTVLDLAVVLRVVLTKEKERESCLKTASARTCKKQNPFQLCTVLKR